MRTSIIALISSSFLVAACSADPFVTKGDPDAAPAPIPGGGDGGTDSGSQLDAAPDVPPLPPTCDGSKLPSEDACVIAEASGVFVSALAAPNGDGTRAKPLGTLAAGIAAGKALKKRVYVCAGSYPEAVTLADGVSMFGGFDCSTWAWAPAGRVKVTAPTSPAMKADAIASPTRVEGFDVVAPAGTANATSSIGMIATSSPGVRFVHGSITAGNGFAGANGADAVQLANGPDAAGQENIAEGKCTGNLAPICIGWHTSRAGGSNACVGKPGYSGGAGGTGGGGGTAIDNGFQWSQQSAPTAGGPTVANASTAAGSDGIGNVQVGAPGAVGASGVNGLAVGSFSAAGYGPSHGTPATDGAPGQGGGGGAGYGQWNGRLNAYAVNTLVYGITGSGGGAGGCPGLAGTAGQGGGASVALIAIDSPLVIDTATLTSGNGGAGGAAGASSAGTAGAPGGPDVTGYGLALVGKYLGAAGGAGGNAGLAGQGGGGPSIGYAVHGTAPVLLGATVTFGTGGAGAPAKSAPAGTIPASPDGLAAKTTTF